MTTIMFLGLWPSLKLLILQKCPQRLNWEAIRIYVKNCNWQIFVTAQAVKYMFFCYFYVIYCWRKVGLEYGYYIGVQERSKACWKRVLATKFFCHFWFWGLGPSCSLAPTSIFEFWSRKVVETFPSQQSVRNGHICIWVMKQCIP